MTVEPMVHVVDNDDAFRSTLEHRLASFGFRVASYPSASMFCDHYVAAERGCLLLDVQMPDASGLVLQKSMAMRALQPAIIAMAAKAEIPLVVRAMHQGAVDFLQKPFGDPELLTALNLALERDRANRLEHARQMSIQERLSLLSPPELDVLRLVLQGKPNKNIAAKLGVSPRTVEDRRARIMHKLRVESVPELVSFAIQGGFKVDSRDING